MSRQNTMHHQHRVHVCCQELHLSSISWRPAQQTSFIPYLAPICALKANSSWCTPGSAAAPAFHSRNNLDDASPTHVLHFCSINIGNRILHVLARCKHCISIPSAVNLQTHIMHLFMLCSEYQGHLLRLYVMDCMRTTRLMCHRTSGSSGSHDETSP